MSFECSIIAQGFRADFRFAPLAIQGSADLEIALSLTSTPLNRGDEADRVYAGCEGVVDVARARQFIAGLRGIVRQLGRQ